MKRRTITWLLLLASISTALTFIPGFDVLSYYFCLPVSALVAMASGGVAVSACLETRRNSLSFWRGVGQALIATILFVLVPLVVVTLASANEPCDYWYGLRFYLCGPISSALCGFATGCLMGTLFRRAWLAHLAFVLTYMASFIADIAYLYSQPAVFFYDPFLGYFPGPIYEEKIDVTEAYWAFRAACIIAIVAAIAIARTTDDFIRHGRLKPLWSAVSLITLITAVFMFSKGDDLKFRVTRDAVEKELSRFISNQWCQLYFDPSLDETLAYRLLHDCSFRYRQALAFFDLSPGGPVRVYIYRDVEQKARLMGSKDVEVSKPWLEEVHIADVVPGEPVLGHEIAHVVAGRLADNMLHLPLMYGIVPDMGVVEGLAVAVAFASEGLSPHEWSFAMMRAGMDIDLESLLGNPGFLFANASKAYTLVGSFVRFLVETRGPSVARALASGQGIEAATGLDKHTLAAEWRDYLEKIVGPLVGPNMIRQASRRFSVPSVLGRKCPLDTARLLNLAMGALNAQDHVAAAHYMDRACEMGGRGSTMRLQSALLHASIGDSEAVAKALAQLDSELGVSELITKADALAILAFKKGELVPSNALEVLTAAIFSGPSPQETRAIAARLLAVALHSEVALLVFTALSGLAGERPDLNLAEAVAMAPDEPLLRYLLGRAQARLGLYDAAVDSLKVAFALGLEPIFRFEALKTLGEAEYWCGRSKEARAHFEAALSAAAHHGDRLFIEEYLSRIAEDQT